MHNTLINDRFWRVDGWKGLPHPNSLNSTNSLSTGLVLDPPFCCNNPLFFLTASLFSSSRSLPLTLISGFFSIPQVYYPREKGWKWHARPLIGARGLLSYCPVQGFGLSPSLSSTHWTGWGTKRRKGLSPGQPTIRKTKGIRKRNTKKKKTKQILRPASEISNTPVWPLQCPWYLFPIFGYTAWFFHVGVPECLHHCFL